MGVRYCLAMEMRMSTISPKTATTLILLLAAVGLMLPVSRELASENSANLPEVRGISIHDAPGGTVTIDISLTRSVPYQTMQLSGPDRLVVDLKGAHKADLKAEYSSRSHLLERVRTGQWKSNPAVFRVVADLKGNPAFSVIPYESGIRVELKPRVGEAGQQHNVKGVEAKPSSHHGAPLRQSAQDDPPPDTFFQVHRFKDLSASLTAPVLPPHDRLVPVAEPDLTPPRHKGHETLALVSGISIQPDNKGETTIDIASSRSVPYRVFQLANPFRLVIDLRDARNTSSQEIYQVNSPVLKRVRVGQWGQGNPSMVRVVADLEGYPVFDVYAQRPGIRIELKPRPAAPRVIRNLFRFETRTQSAKMKRLATPPNQTLAAVIDPPAAVPGNDFSNLALIGFIDKKDAGTQAVISHHSNVFLVSKGDIFENIFTVLVVSANAVEVQDTKTLETKWIPYSPK
ncbi:MAG: AMIN domain-containing protein [Acidobacteria bacterium]|nr:MAG: AMIN domain-containing protein [Acidobacteriota bacterium]